MKNREFFTMILTLMMTVLLTSSGWSAVATRNNHMTPELAAKREMVRKQQEQRITPDKRKAAAEALKAERLRVYRAKQAVKQSAPAPLESK